MSTPSLTVDITDTNLLLDDLLHQLSLHSDYALLRHIKQSYSAIHGSRQQQQAEVKKMVEELTRAVQGLQQSVKAVGVTEIKAWRDGVKGSVSEKEEEVQELQLQAGRLAGDVEEKEEEGKELERRRKEMLRKHQDAMQSHRKCLRLYSILSAVQFDVVDETQIRGTYHGVDSAQRSFAYQIDEVKDGCSAFDATNSLWAQLWAPTARETLAKATAQRPQAAAAAVPQQHSGGHFSLMQFAA